MAKEHYQIMISSTYTELKDHRAAVSQSALGQHMFPLDMANDAAIPDQDLIGASLSKVDEADAYVGLISFRYGQIIECSERNPSHLSLTELEFRHALKRRIPICMFIMSDSYPIPHAAVAKEFATLDKLAAFKTLAKEDRIYAEFNSVDDLKAKVTQTLARLKTVLDKATPPPPTLDSPAPPAFHAKPPYIAGYKFQGRVKELAAITDWAASADSMLLFEAIGGMGKSMVTWEWVKNHAAIENPNWAGTLWYSFYERGADMKDFCVTALSYITRRPREDFRQRPNWDLADQLLPLLRARPFLLVLDGLERALVAYNRYDAAQLRDEDAETSQGATGTSPTNCIRPDDDDLLRELCAASPSKILVSSRLMPRVLLNHLGQPLQGVRRLQLPGLDPRDAELMLREANITGDSERMRQYMGRQFGCNPLVVGVVGGLVRNNLRARGSFDRWLNDPDGGGSVNLANSDIVQRRTHILKLAFDGLDPMARDLLARIAMIANAVELDVLEALNPARPPPPEKVAEPTTHGPEKDDFVEYLRLRLAQPTERQQRPVLEQQIADRLQARQDGHDTARRAFAKYQSAVGVWRTSEAVRAAERWLNIALGDLETRGLLQCDRQAGKFDLHPVVRGYAIGALTNEARAQTGQLVADYFSSRPEPSYETATSLEELADGIQVVQALTQAGKPVAAWNVLNGDLSRAMYRLERHHERLALLRAFFPDGWSAPPVGVDDFGLVATAAALDLNQTGLSAEASVQAAFSIREAIEIGVSSSLCIRLRNHSLTALQNGELARSSRILAFARHVAVAAGDAEQTFKCDLISVNDRIDRGALAEARARWASLAPLLPDQIRRDGQLEAQAILNEALLLFREGALNAQSIATAIARAHALCYSFVDRALLALTADWHRANRRDEAAIHSYAGAIEMAHAVGLRDTRSEAGRGLCLIKLGRRAEAEAAAASAERDPPHNLLAQLYLELKRNDQARHHATEGYKRYWADGPPYTFHWQLQTCRAVLKALNEPEPQLTPYDPARVRPIEYEADIRRLLAEEASRNNWRPIDTFP